MTRQEAGRIGGLVTAAKYGSNHMATIGSRGFQAFANRHCGGNRRKAREVLKLDGVRRDYLPEDPWRHLWLVARESPFTLIGSESPF
jgi:hypothetical protein